MLRRGLLIAAAMAVLLGILYFLLSMSTASHDESSLPSSCSPRAAYASLATATSQTTAA